MEGHSARLRDRSRFISAVRRNRHTHLCWEGGEFGQSSISVNTVEVVVLADVDPPLLTPGAPPAPPSSAGNHPLSNLQVGHPSSSRHYDPIFTWRTTSSGPGGPGSRTPSILTSPGP